MNEVLVALGGATVFAVTDAILDLKASEWFPQWDNKPLFGVEPLPPVDDWAVLIVAGAVYLVGRRYNETVKFIGEGAVIYKAPSVLATAIIRSQLYMGTPTAQLVTVVTPPTLVIRGG